MASVRLNIYENISLFQRGALGGLLGVGSLHIQGVEIPGSISFNNIQLVLSQGHTSASITISFGLYSLTGATLSLANSASRSFNTNANGLNWITFATSATQDITPGNWYLGLMSSTSGQNSMSIFRNAGFAFSQGAYGGGFVRGFLSVSTSVLPGSIATSDMSKEGLSGTGGSNAHPYILISA